ncbi:hypothetical protein [Hydrogenophaga pseudoflava]|uniref:hypothetical protein n=1 Tax=Hydrogenophaga pseudoflava TaxID=47421 RepID=UPI0027E598F2|nr:hypothetical protein [Hydrogenophaga pseudoflava]MDQ7743548.1 hypothetical protein [Hydrogenophaga pseudoflava]
MNRHASSLELMLFESGAAGAKAMMAAGIDHFVVDWEYMGKTERQKEFDTEIAPVGPQALSDVARLPGARTWCRINGEGAHTPEEVEIAVGAGARGIFLPMAHSPAEVERFLRLVDGRCQVGILVETTAALSCARSLATLPLDRVYFGLNDFAISRGGGSIFRAVLDGSVERAREAFSHTPFGFGGVTAVDGGTPVPCARLLEEMARLDCQFVFLRRSFRRDVQRLGAARLTAEVAAYWQRCRARTAAETAHDRRTLERLLAEVCDAV